MACCLSVCGNRWGWECGLGSEIEARKALDGVHWQLMEGVGDDGGVLI